MRMARAAMTLWSTSLTRSRTRVSRLIISYGLRSFTAATPRPTIHRPERQRSETEWNALSAKPCKPLRILFCGSDEFSIAALKAIHELRKWHPDYIKSIDVLCRPGKRTGRGMKVIATIPLKIFAQELGLPIHERDTFTGWELPKPDGEPINLIIAVSFGLFVPPRILKSAEYGGLNLHPSLLPDYRGPAPLKRMIMNGATTGGITLQTLDDKAFDHGTILLQDFIPKSAFPQESYHSTLRNFIEPRAIEVLIKGLREKLFVPPIIPGHRRWGNKQLHPNKLIHATKITTADKKVDWEGGDAAKIMNTYRALFRLWSEFSVDQTQTSRLVFDDFELVMLPTSLREWVTYKGTQPEELVRINSAKEDWAKVHFIVTGDTKRPVFYVENGDTVIFAVGLQGLRVQNITPAGSKQSPARLGLQHLQREAWTLKPQPSGGFLGACSWDVEPAPKSAKNTAR